MAGVTRVEDLEVYQRLCRLHLNVCALAEAWPRHERFELTSQVRRSSNSAAANLAEKHSDRHMKNRIEGVNRARGETLETIHHLYIAKLKGYLAEQAYEDLREHYAGCVRMLNGLERAFERQLPDGERRWPPRSQEIGSQEKPEATTATRPPKTQDRKLKTEN